MYKGGYQRSELGRDKNAADKGEITLWIRGENNASEMFRIKNIYIKCLNKGEKNVINRGGK
jgi:hypothetical protein